MEITTAPGVASPTDLLPGQSITAAVTPVWEHHKDRHRQHCGAVNGPLRNLICRQGHTL
jgi:hypothetical protein